MKNYWLDRKKQFEIPEIPPINFPCFELTNIPNGDINLPPIIFGCIDISSIPTEIKLVAPDPMPAIQLDMPVFPTTLYCGTAGPADIPPVIKVDWGTPPVINCTITVG